MSLVSDPTQTTPLMCVEVGAIVPAKQQAYIRCAGSMGADTYEEVVAQSRTQIFVEHTSDPTIGSDEALSHHHAPISFPVHNKHMPGMNSTTTLVLTTTVIVNPPLLSLQVLQRLIDIRPIQHLRIISPGPHEAPLTYLYKFLGYSDTLSTIDIRGLRDLVHAGHDFLCRIFSITSIDLSPLYNVATIGMNFMAGCTSLTSIDLTPLSNVTIIDSSFM